MEIPIKAVNTVEMLTLQDNYIDFFAFKENSQMMQRPVPVKKTARGMELRQPPGAEHGWPSLITVHKGRNAISAFEHAMPDQFVLNMAGTKLLLSST